MLDVLVEPVESCIEVGVGAYYQCSTSFVLARSHSV